MTVEEQRLVRLYEAARGTWGDEEAATLMDQLCRWQDPATRSDVAALGARLEGVRAELRGEMAELRGEFSELRGEVRGEMGGLRGEMGGLRGEMGDLRREMGELSARLTDAMSAQVTRILAILVPTILAAVALAFAAGSVP